MNLANYENRLRSMDSRLGRVETKLDALGQTLADFRTEVGHRFTVLTWAIGVNAAATIAILGVLLRH
jgi:hypothetical protein